MKKSVAAYWVIALSLVFVTFVMIAEARAQVLDRGLSFRGLPSVQGIFRNSQPLLYQPSTLKRASALSNSLRAFEDELKIQQQVSISA